MTQRVKMQYVRAIKKPGHIHSLLAQQCPNSGPIELGGESSTAAKRAASSFCQGSEEPPRNTVCDTAGKRGQREATAKRNPRSTRDTEAGKKRRDRLQKCYKQHNKDITRERDLHWVAVDDELLRCEVCDWSRGV